MSPECKALHKAVADFSRKTGANAASLSTIAEKLVGLLSGRWEHVCDVAMDESNKGELPLHSVCSSTSRARCPAASSR
jgi:hypothetical protein